MSVSKLIAKVSQVERTDKNGNKFIVGKFAELSKVNTPMGELFVADLDNVKSKNCWESAWVKSEELAFNAPIYDASTPQAGGWFLGSIETREVIEYYINNEPRNVFSCVVFGDSQSTDYEEKVQKAFESNGRVLATASTTKEEPVIVINEEAKVTEKTLVV